MQLLFDIVRWIHILSGFLALCVFWIPIATKKGGRTHNRAGWVYVWAMVCVSVSAFLMGVYRLTWDAGSDPDAIPYSWFLLFIAVLSSSTAWYGVRVLRHKRRKETHRKPIDFMFPALLFGSGIGISFLWLGYRFSIAEIFSIYRYILGRNTNIVLGNYPQDEIALGRGAHCRHVVVLHCHCYCFYGIWRSAIAAH